MALRSRLLSLGLLLPFCAGQHFLYSADTSTLPTSYEGFPTMECSNHGAPRAWVSNDSISGGGSNSSSSSSSSSKPVGSVLFGTAYAQRKIWEHQHPADCSKVKFLITNMGPDGHGIGSQIHVLGQVLAIAMRMGRVLLLNHDPSVWTKGEHCRGTTTIDECYFEPLTSCSLRDAGNPANWTKFVPFTGMVDKIKDDRFVYSDAMAICHDPVEAYRWVPQIFEPLLEKSSITRDKWYYWWRSQSTAYIMRPNARTLAKIEERKAAYLRPASALPPNTVSVYYRSGDKIKENPDIVQSPEAYLSLVAKFSQPNSTAAPTNVFLRTMDSNFLNVFLKQPNVSTYYLDVPRYHDDRTPMRHAQQIGPDNEYINNLVALDLSLECDSWIVTMLSNSGRLIEELRSTVRCKAHLPLYDPDSSSTLTKPQRLEWRRMLRR